MQSDQQKASTSHVQQENSQVNNVCLLLGIHLAIVNENISFFLSAITNQ